MYFSGWRATIILVAGLVVLALLLTALFWLGILLAVLAAVAWFNIFLLPRLAYRTRIPELVLAVALLPISAAAGLGLAGTSGIVAGCSIWVLGVALPRVVMWRLRRRLSRRTRLSSSRVIDTRYSTKNSW